MPGKADRTKGRILEAARALFNARGIPGVDTHDIAAAARMSPGNLYYHYRNKGEIVRDLVDTIEIYSEAAWRRHGPKAERPSFPDLVAFFFGSVARHRFFFRESSRLLRQDAALAEVWRARHRRLSSKLAQTAQGWVDAGIMRPFEGRGELRDFVDNAWILCHYAADYLESKGVGPAERAHREAMRLLLRFLRPYHTEAGLAALDRYEADLEYLS